MTDAPAPEPGTSTRFAAVVSPAAERAGHAPPGIDAGELRLAMLEDTYEVVAGLQLVTSALVLHPAGPPDAADVTWPGTPVIREPSLTGAFAALHGLGADAAALVAPDAPDLPPLLIGKLFRALGSAPSAACRAENGTGLVALAARLPLPHWLATALHDIDLDTPDALPRLRAAAPRPGLIPQGPAWHRLRMAADLRFLDPGLEGWETTRALLEGHPLNS